MGVKDRTLPHSDIMIALHYSFAVEAKARLILPVCFVLVL